MRVASLIVPSSQANLLEWKARVGTQRSSASTRNFWHAIHHSIRSGEQPEAHLAGGGASCGFFGVHQLDFERVWELQL